MGQINYDILNRQKLKNLNNGRYLTVFL